MVITHEQWFLTSFLRLDSLELKLVQFSLILELWIIIYELITNYPRLIIKLELIIKQNYFIILFQRLSLNSNYRIEIILLLNLVMLLRISKGQTKFEFEFELNWINRMENNKQHCTTRLDSQCPRPTQRKWSSPPEPFSPADWNRGFNPHLRQRGSADRFRSTGGDSPEKVVPRKRHGPRGTRGWR
jgi:hypothetical protein